MIVLPMHFITSLAFARRSDLALDVQARLAIVVSAMVLAWTFWRLLKAGMISLGRGLGDKPSVIRSLLRGLVPVLLLINVGLALSGYIYSSGMELQALLEKYQLDHCGRHRTGHAGALVSGGGTTAGAAAT